MKQLFILLTLFSYLAAGNIDTKLHNLLEQTNKKVKADRLCFIVVNLKDNKTHITQKNNIDKTENVALDFLYEPGKVIYPLLISPLNNQRYYNYFYSLDKHIKEVANSFNPDALQTLELNKALEFNGTFTKKPILPNKKHLSHPIVKRVLLLGYGVKLTPYHIINGYKKALQSRNNKQLKMFLKENFKKYFSKIGKDIGVVGGLSRAIIKKRYTKEGKRLTYIGLIGTKQGSYLVLVMVDFKDLVKNRKVQDTFWIVEDIQRVLEK